MGVKTRLELLAEFAAAPSSALFPSATIAALRRCSVGNIERDRWRGTGVPFIRIGHTIRYRKADYLAWERQHRSVRSTAEADAQSMRLQGADYTSSNTRPTLTLKKKKGVHHG